jgi:hypothetical protein
MSSPTAKMSSTTGRTSTASLNQDLYVHPASSSRDGVCSPGEGAQAEETVTIVVTDSDSASQDSDSESDSADSDSAAEEVGSVLSSPTTESSAEATLYNTQATENPTNKQKQTQKQTTEPTEHPTAPTDHPPAVNWHLLSLLAFLALLTPFLLGQVLSATNTTMQFLSFDFNVCGTHVEEDETSLAQNQSRNQPTRSYRVYKTVACPKQKTYEMASVVAVFIACAVGSYFGGIFCEKWGRVGFLVRGNAVGVVAFVVTAFSVNFPMFVVMRGICGKRDFRFLVTDYDLNLIFKGEKSM